MPSFRVSMRIFKQTAALQSSKWLFAAVTGTLFLASVNVASAQTTGAWIGLPPMPTARIGPGVAAVNGIIYTIGGQDPITGQPVTTVEPFDTHTKTWGTAAQLPIPIGHPVAAATPDGKLHVVGGCLDANCSSPTNTHLKYDPATNSWSFGTPMPTPRWGHSLVTAPSGMLFAFGGAQGTTLNPPTLGCPDTSALEINNFGTDTWATGTAMSTGRFGEAAYPDQSGQIIAAAGKTCDLPNLGTTPLSDVLVYDLTTNTWIQNKIPSLPYTMSRATGFSQNGALYVMDGNTGGACNGCIFKYDPAINATAWVQDTPDPVSRYGGRGALVNGIFYLLGGVDAVTGLALSTNEAFTTGRLQPPAIDKSFSPTAIQPIGGSGTTTSTLTFSITNPNTVEIDASFTDTLPTNVGFPPHSLVLANPPNTVNNCVGSVTTAVSSISFSSASLPPGTCTIQVNVQSDADHVYANSVTINSTAAGNGNTSSASLTVAKPAQIGKSFARATIALNGTTTLTFTITNDNFSHGLTGVTFTDMLPPGLTVAPTPNASTNCGGTLTAAAGSSSISLSGGTVPGPPCTISVDVQGTQIGTLSNSVTVSDAVVGTGNTSIATLTVLSTKVVLPPVITKVFSPATIPLNGTTTLTFTITNPNTDRTLPLTGVTFTDTLPPGLTVAPTPNASTNCGGTLTAAAGSSSISLSGGTVGPGAPCTVSVSVQGTTAGLKTNSVQVTATESGLLANTATATVNVIAPAPPSITKNFASPTMRLNGGATALTFTITNPNQSATLTGISFTDNFPQGLVLTNPNGLITFCSGTITAVPGTAIVTLAGASLAPNSSCSFTIDVTGTSAGVKNNITTAVTSNEAGPGNAAKDTVTVVAPPVISKSFGDVSIQLNAATTLTFTIANPNTTVALTGVSFVDNIPAGLSVLTPSAFITGCPPGTGNSAGGLIVAFGGAVLPPSGSCSITVRVSGTAVGTKDNTTLPVTSNEGGQGNTASATITVLGPPLISKRFGAASIPLAGTTPLTFTITNPNDATLTGITFSDVLPSGLLIATPNGQTETCGGIISALAGSNTISLSSMTLLPGASCTLSVNVIGIAVGAQNNVTGKISAAGVGTGGAASATINVIYTQCLLYDPTRAVQSGSTIPLKFQLCDANNADVSSSAVVVHAVKLVQVSTNASEIIDAAGNANPDNDFRFDSSLGPTGGYIFNLQTTGLTTGTYALYFVVGNDPTTYVLFFQVR